MVELNERQLKILNIVKTQGPITGEAIGEILMVTRATLRPDLTVLTMAGYLEAKPRVGYTYKSDCIDNQIASILNKYRVKDIQSMAVVVKEECSIYDAIVTLFIEDTGSIFIVDKENFLAGIVSRKDLLKATLGQADIHKMPVSVIMTRMPNIVTTSREDNLISAVKKIVEHEVDSLPVVKCYIGAKGEENYEVVGRVTKTNISRLLLDLASH